MAAQPSDHKGDIALHIKAQDSSNDDGQAASSSESRTSSSSGGLDLSHPALHILVERFQLVLLTPLGDVQLPGDLLAKSLQEDPFFCIVRRSGELNVIMTLESVPQWLQAFKHNESIAKPSSWSVLRVRGPLELSMIGVMADLSGVLKKAGVSLFVISTHHTDLVMVAPASLDKAVSALSQAGWQIRLAE